MNAGYEKLKEHFGQAVADEVAAIIAEGEKRNDVTWTMEQLRIVCEKATRDPVDQLEDNAKKAQRILDK